MHPQSQRLTELFSARLSPSARDDVAAIVLGPRLCGVCVALGAPERDWWRIAQWATRLDDSRVCDEFGAYLDVLVAYRCARPGEDVISDLIAYDVDGDGDGLTADEIRGILVDFVRAGVQPV
ncbi:hypothetical protein [Mycobacterium sp. NAZ190054]|uniref:hypothetical protein n=1 Tax=Mycobacterium sp. NAZ190054 TaxID=1747766 RepID=UPI00079377BB|nr:hypothetical protein [Mycobacterium sp. NAZ190054]KWX57484.1 hypothetical protein ASJ79_11330 [Mycobacterium sp. NAZ190054]